MKKFVLRLSLFFTLIFTFVFVGSYWFLQGDRGVSSPYITRLIQSEVQSRIPDSTLHINQAGFFLDIKRYAVAFRAMDVSIAVDNVPLASVAHLDFSLDIVQSFKQKTFVFKNIHLQDGVITYGDQDLLPFSVSKTKPSFDVRSEKRMIQNIAGLLSETYTMTKDIGNVSAQNIRLSYAHQGKTVTVRFDMAHMTHNKTTQSVFFQGGVDVNTSPYGFVDLGTMKLQFSHTMMADGGHVKLDAQGLSHAFSLGLDTTYDTQQSMVNGGFYMTVDDTRYIQYIKTVLPKLALQKSMHVNAKWQDYSLQNGGKIYMDYKIDGYYGTALRTQTPRGWDVQVKLRNASDAVMLQYVKSFTKPDMVAWLRDNVRATYDVDVTVQWDTTLHKAKNIVSTWTLKNGKIVYAKGLPVLSFPKAVASFVPNGDMHVTLKRGEIVVDTMPITITHVQVKTPEQGTTQYQGDIRGDVRAISALLFHKNSTLKNPYPNVSVTQGIFTGKWAMSYSRTHKKFQNYHMQGTFQDTHISVPYKMGKGRMQQYALHAPHIKITLRDTHTLDVQGRIQSPILGAGDFVFRKHTSDVDIDFKGIVSKNALSYVGMDTYIAPASGMPIHMTFNGTGLNNGRIKVHSDFSATRLDSRMLDWHKPSGVSANAMMDIHLRPKQDYKVVASVAIGGVFPLALQSEILLDEDGIRHVHIPKFQLKKDTFTILGVRQNTHIQWQVKGAYLRRKTIQAVLDMGKVNRPTDKKPDIHITFDLEKFEGYNGVMLAQVAGTYIRKNNQVHHIRLQVSSTDTRPKQLYLDYTPKKLRFLSEDVGLYYNAMYKNPVFGKGRLAMVASADDTGVLVGRLQGQNISIVNTPESVRLLKLFSVVGIFDALQDKDIHFSRVSGRFKIQDSIFSTPNISALGNVAVSGKGYLNFSKKTLDIHGMIMPTYQLSRFVSKIPLIGKILTGVNEQGFLAQNYTAVGTLDNHKVQIQPASLLTVGILRDMVAPILGAENVPLKIQD